MEDFDWIKRVILRYFRSIENCAPSSYIHGGVHSLNSWWDPPWIWKEGPPFLCTPRVPKNFSNKKWIINNWEMLRNTLRVLVKNLVKKSFFHNFKFKITHKQLLLYQITFTNHKKWKFFQAAWWCKQQEFTSI